MKFKIEVIEVLLHHCRVLAKANDPWKRIAASEVEIELRTWLEKMKAEWPSDSPKYSP